MSGFVPPAAGSDCRRIPSLWKAPGIGLTVVGRPRISVGDAARALQPESCSLIARDCGLPLETRDRDGFGEGGKPRPRRLLSASVATASGPPLGRGIVPGANPKGDLAPFRRLPAYGGTDGLKAVHRRWFGDADRKGMKAWEAWCRRGGDPRPYGGMCCAAPLPAPGGHAAATPFSANGKRFALFMQMNIIVKFFDAGCDR